MNDNDLMTAVRDSFAPVRMDTPAKVIVARGRSLRRHGRGGRLAAGALAAGLGAGLSVPAITAGTTAAAGHDTANGAADHATLAAWTVQKHHDGSIGVTIRKPRDLVALQRRIASLGARIIIDLGPANCLPRGSETAPPKIATLRQAPHAVAFDIRSVKIPADKVLLILLPLAGKGPVPVPAVLGGQDLRGAKAVLVPRGSGHDTRPVPAVTILKCSS